MDYFETMKVGIVLASIYTIVTQFWQGMLMCKRKSPSAWVHFGLALAGVYWLWYYLRSLLDYAPFNAHQIYFRGPLMITIALIGAAGAYAVRRYK